MGILVYKTLLLVTAIVVVAAQEKSFKIFKRNGHENVGIAKQVEKRSSNIFTSIINSFVQPVCRILGCQGNCNKADPCINNPCKYGGQCGSTNKGTDYFCYDCPYPMGGKDCSELDCGMECFRHKDTVFFVYQMSGTWDAANKNCIRSHQTLAILNDKETDDAVREYFKKRYAGQPNIQDAMWIGLHRDSTSDSFEWIDEEPLGLYTNWASGKPDNDKCVNIGNGGRFHFKWDADPCSGASGWTYFPLCQKILA